MTKRRAHYTPRIAEDICELVALGKTLRQALVEVGPLAPTIATVWKWQDSVPEFGEKMERARQFSADGHADLMLEMAQQVIATPSKASAIKVASDILKWQAEIRNSKKYGSKVQHELTKPPMSPLELRAEIKALEAELGVKAVPGMNTAPVFTRKTEAELANPAQPKPEPEEVAVEPEAMDLATRQSDIHNAFDAEGPPWVQ